MRFFFFFALFLSCVNSYSQVQVIDHHEGHEHHHDHESFCEVPGLRAFESVTLDMVDLYRRFLENETEILKLHLPEGESLKLFLWEHKLFADDYRLQLASGRQREGTRPLTFRGIIDGDLNSEVSLTINRGFLRVMIAGPEDTWYVEQRNRYDDRYSKDEMIVYKSSDVINPHRECGLAHYSRFKRQMEEIAKNQREQMRVDECLDVQIALATDWLLFQEQGGETQTENEVTGILNDVQTNYDDEFDDELNYVIETVWISDCSSCDPWTSSTDSGALLDDFTDWGQDGGFGVTHDVATLWSDRDFNGSTIGLAWVGVICTNFRYNICEHFTNNANLLRVLQAHELGHNWDASHDGNGTSFIMSPSVSNTNDWSTNSQNEINSFIPSRNCLSECGNSGEPPLAELSADITDVCTGGTVQFTDQSAFAPTTWEWSFPGGSPSSSTDQHPKVVYNSPGTYNVTLEVSNANGSDEITRFSYITVGSGGQDIIECINFEDGLEDWTIDNPDNNTGWEIQETPGARYGDNSLVLNNFGYNATGQRDALLSPIMDFEARDNLTLLVEYAYARRGGNFRDSMIISISTDGGSTFTQLFGDTENGNGNFATAPQTGLNFVPEDFDDWCLQGFGPNCLSIDLTPYKTATEAQIMIENVNGRGNNMYLDNISIVATCAPSSAPTADFQGVPNTGCIPLQVEFFDISQGQVQFWNWSFPGGTPSSSTEQNPVVTYDAVGEYDVTLEVANIVGTDQLLRTEYIVASDVPAAAFDYTIDGLTVTFVNMSSGGGGFLWDFGDGNTSIEDNPVHTYATDGNYTVTLTMTNACGTDVVTDLLLIVTPPSASFEADAPVGCAPHEVQFINNSSANSTGYQWTFEGGSPGTSSDFEPTVIYETAGTYSVTLVVSNGAGSDELTLEDYIVIGDVPLAGFDFVINDLDVAFVNESIDADSYEWDFGDGGESTSMNPNHSYPSDGTYLVTLIATNDCGTDTITSEVTISNRPTSNFSGSPVEGCVPLVVQFTNNSSSNSDSFEWTFEGGTPATSTDPAPTVTYNNTGVFDVELIASNAEGSDTLTRLEYVVVAQDPVAMFESSGVDLTFTFTNLSTDATSYDWDFGDGNGSEEENPVHTYDAPGDYTVILTVINICGEDEIALEISIPDIPTADFQAQVTEGCVPLEVQFADNSSANTVSVEWIFEGGDPAESTERNPLVSYTMAGVYDVTLISYSVNSTDTLVMEDFIVALDIPVADYSATNNGLEILFDSDSPDAYDHLWDFGDGNMSTDPDPAHTYEQDGSYEVCLTVTNDCGEDMTCSTVMTSIPPIPDWSAESTVGCTPFVVEYRDESQGNPSSWDWTFEGGTPSSSDEQNPIITYQSPGTYDVTLTVVNDQGEVTETYEDTIVVSRAPSAGFSAELDGFEVRFDDQSAAADSVSWDFGDGNTSGDRNPTHTYSEEGEYLVTQYAYNDCGVDSTELNVVIVMSSVGDIAELDLEIFPNPTRDLLFVKGAFAQMQIRSIEVIDLLGRQVWMRSEITDDLQIECTDWPRGSYALLISTEDRRYVTKIIVQ